MINPDKELDVELDRKKEVREIFRKFGEQTAILLVLSELTGKPLAEVCDVWTKNKKLLHGSLGRSST